MKSRLLVALLAAAGFCLSVGANAADINRSATLSFTDSTIFFGDTFGQADFNKTFEDKLLFTTVGLNDLDALVSSIRTKSKADLDITGFSLNNGSGTVAAGTQNSTGAIDLWTISTTSLAAGNYFLQINGKVVGSSGGSFGGNVNVSPVPEPSTWGMLAAGLGLLGFAARRKNAK